ncbi:ABC transporter ATP-binding protein [Cetobacterium somerae]|uniref:ABC transporter ATP-binding protein n=1 Tax=Cetobacterium somerae TaxID=188913 RepID=UPI00248E55E0|nr:ABC transporter ATP-binding protein [Cetobacterium somerae]
MVILNVTNLSIEEISKINRVVVDEISFSLKKGEVLGIVGESGSGKTVTAMSLLNLLSDDLKISKGTINFLGTDICQASEKELEKIRGNSFSIIFQNPISSLNPLMKVGKQILEVIEKHQNLDKKQMLNRTFEVLSDVGFKDNFMEIYNKYPHELSGGQGQRIGIAMAIANNPKIIIADEPTTALDKNTQAQILNLLKEIQNKYQTSIILISHDLEIIKNFTDNALIMYFGQIVESGSTYDIFLNPNHHYTKGLLDSLPENFKKGEPIKVMKGGIPNINDNIEGCFFSPRCPAAIENCKKNRIMYNFDKKNHKGIRCINPLKEKNL